MLTTDFLTGLPPAPAAELRLVGLDPEAVLRAGAAAMLRMVSSSGSSTPTPTPATCCSYLVTGSASSISAWSGGLTPASGGGWL